MTDKTAADTPTRLPTARGEAPVAAAARATGTDAGAKSKQPAESPWWLSLWLIGLIAVVVSPGLLWGGLAVRPYVIRLDLVAMITAIVASIALALVAILSRGFRHRTRWSLGVGTVVILVVFQWPLISLSAHIVSSRLSLPLIADAIPVAVAAALLYLAVRRANSKVFGFLVAGAGALFIAYSANALLPLLPPRPAPVEAAAAPAEASDALLVVLDGYARQDVLAEAFQFDNAPFIAELEARGFAVPAGATANYNSTFASLSTMLAQDYTYSLGTLDESDNDPMRNALAGDAALIRRFKEAGYDIGYTESAWAGSTCSALVDVCIRDGLTYRAFWYLGKSTMLAPLLDNWLPHAFSLVSFNQLGDLPDFLERNRSSETPRLTVAHVILPHPPYERDADCNYLSEAAGREFETTDAALVDERRALYTDQTLCTNRLLLAGLDKIIAAHPGINVMLTADHGSATTTPIDNTSESRSDDVVTERMAIFSAYRLPGCDIVVPATITPVNGTRVLSNCALTSSLEPVEDRNYWIPPNRQGTVVDVGPRLGN